MSKQHAPVQQRGDLTSPQTETPTPRSSPSPSGNNRRQDQLRFLADIQDWLRYQQVMLEGLEGTHRVQRIHGILRVVSEQSHAFRQGRDLDLSALPTAPSAPHAPALENLLPGIASAVQPFQRALVSPPQLEPQHPSPVPADMFRMGEVMNLFNSAPPSGEFQSVTTTGGKQTTQIQRLASQVMGLKLKLPGEKGVFSLQKYGDRSSLVTILKHCIEGGIKSPDQVAYILATAWHESRLGTWMTESGWLSEKSAERYAEKNYGPQGRNPSRAKRQGNTKKGDGGRYMGRGYVQLTWKNNYERMSSILVENNFTYTQDGVTYGSGKDGTKRIDLVRNYKHVNRNKELAARILVLGMDGGHYVGDNKGLDSYIPENGTATSANFQSARKIVNGSDKKKLIAGNASTITAVLRKNGAWEKIVNAKNTIV